MPAAAAVIIGNEVLSAKVVDANTPHLIAKLRERGVALAGIHMVLDDVDAIVEAVTAARRRAKWVITSGGIGPTHDDVTVAAVAYALGRDLVELAAMRSLIEKAYGGAAVPAAAFRMALAPRGSALLYGTSPGFPVLTCDNVFMLPGVPSFFRLQLDTVLQGLPKGEVALASVFVSAGEPELAEALDAVANAFVDVSFGSYPTFESNADFRVKLTVEHSKGERVKEALGALLAALPNSVIVRVEPNSGAE